MIKLKNWVQNLLEIITLLCCGVLLININSTSYTINIICLVVIAFNVAILWNYGNWSD